MLAIRFEPLHKDLFMYKFRALLVVCCSASALFCGPFEIIKSSLHRLRTNDPGAAEDIKSDSLPMRTVTRELNLVSAPWKVKLLASEWLLRAHLLSTRKTEASSPDISLLNRSWEMVSVSMDQVYTYAYGPTAADLARLENDRLIKRNPSLVALSKSLKVEKPTKEVEDLIMWLRVETSVRMNDLLKMKEALSAFHFREDMDPRARTYAMMAAFHTGDWNLASTIGKSLKSNPKILASIYQQSARVPTSFDYSALLLWLEQTRPEPFKGTLTVAQAKVKELRFKLREVAGETAAQAVMARSGDTFEWKTVADAYSLQHSGAVSHLLLPFGNQMALSGALEGDTISLVGYQDRTEGRFVDQLRISRIKDKANCWAGQLTCSTPSSIGQSYIYDVEFELSWDQSGLAH